MSHFYKFFISISVMLIITACGGGDNPNAEDGIQVSITVSNLPTEVTINKADTPDGRVEYNWAVTFDMDNNGAFSTGDIVLQILHFKRPGSAETTVNVDSLPADLWLLTSSTQTQSQFPIDMSISGNTITMSIERSALAALQTIDESTMVFFDTSYYDSNSGLNAFDYYPDVLGFVNIPTSGMFTDPAADTAFDLIDMIEMDIVL